VFSVETDHNIANKKQLRNGKRAYFTSSLFFHRKFLLWHFLHFVAVAAFLDPQSLQIFMCNLAFCAIAFLTGSNIGIKQTFFSG
jgi:hypothetical protein